LVGIGKEIVEKCKQIWFHPNLVGIGCLECLQTLIIFNCENLENLCEDMQGLRRLRKLLIVECNSLISLPRSIKCLTTLEEFYINECKKLDLMTIKKKKRENNSTSFPFPLYCNIWQLTINYCFTRTTFSRIYRILTNIYHQRLSKHWKNARLHRQFK